MTQDKKHPRQIVYEKALPFAKENYKEIAVKMGKYDGSQRCQHISRQLLEEGNADSVAVTLSFVPNSGVNVHFINRVKEHYVDNTLGYLSKQNFYFLISEHTLENLKDVNMSKMLTKIKKEMLSALFSEAEIETLSIDTAHI